MFLCIRIVTTVTSKSNDTWIDWLCGKLCVEWGVPTPVGTSVFTKHNWDMGVGHLWLNGLGIYDLMGGAFIT